MGSRSDVLHALRRGRAYGGAALREVKSAELFNNIPSTKPLYEQFAEELSAVQGECYPVFSKAEAAAYLLRLVGDIEKRVIYLDSPIVEAALKVNKQLFDRVQHGAYSKSKEISNELFGQFDVAITGADYLVARTGTVVMRSTTQGGRRLSILPKFHIVVAYETQLVATLGECLPELKCDPSWSSTAIITGPSRTSDIEKTLVLGAHGPRRLAVIIEREKEDSPFG